MGFKVLLDQLCNIKNEEVKKMHKIRKILSKKDAEEYAGKVVALNSISPDRSVIASGITLEELLKDMELKGISSNDAVLFDNRKEYPFLVLEDFEGA